MMHQLDDRRRRQSLVYVGGALSPQIENMVMPTLFCALYARIFKNRAPFALLLILMWAVCLSPLCSRSCVDTQLQTAMGFFKFFATSLGLVGPMGGN